MCAPGSGSGEPVPPRPPGQAEPSAEPDLRPVFPYANIQSSSASISPDRQSAMTALLVSSCLLCLVYSPSGPWVITVRRRPGGTSDSTAPLTSREDRGLCPGPSSRSAMPPPAPSFARALRKRGARSASLPRQRARIVHSALGFMRTVPPHQSVSSSGWATMQTTGPCTPSGPERSDRFRGVPTSGPERPAMAYTRSCPAERRGHLPRQHRRCHETGKASPSPKAPGSVASKRGLA